MGKYKCVAMNFDKDILKSAMNLMNQVATDEDLEFFKNHTGSKQNWLRYLFQRGLTQTRKDFEKWKKMESQED